jgi:hypothetical protein
MVYYSSPIQPEIQYSVQMKIAHINQIIAVVSVLTLACSPGSKQKINIEIITQAKKIDITVDGKLFTSYCYSDTLKKQFCFP